MDFATFGKTYPKVTDFTTNKDPDGIQIQYSRSEDVVQLSGACIEGDVLVYVSPTTTAPLTAAKMGLVGFTRVLANEGRKYNIKANAIAPVAKTRMTEELLGAFGDKLEASEVTPTVAYLAHEDCPVTGEIYSVAGGSVSRFFIGLMPGYYKNGHSVEDVRDNFDLIRNEEGYIVPEGPQDELGKLLGVRGRVLPATVEPVDLVALTVDGRRVRDQVAVMGTSGIDRVSLSPADAHVAPDVLERIDAAELTTCSSCGAPSSGEICAFCFLVQRAAGAEPVVLTVKGSS